MQAAPSIDAAGTTLVSACRDDGATIARSALRYAGGAAVRAATGSWRTPPPPAAVMNAAITTSEVRSHEGDAQPWMMVDVARTDAEARLSAQWALKASAFRTLEQAETTRREHFSGWSAAQASTLAALQKQAAKGRGEQADCLSFLQQRAAADLAYAASFSKHRLGGKKALFE